MSAAALSHPPIIIRILRHLPVRDFLQSRLVCRAWHALTERSEYLWKLASLQRWGDGTRGGLDQQLASRNVRIVLHEGTRNYWKDYFLRRTDAEQTSSKRIALMRHVLDKYAALQHPKYLDALGELTDRERHRLEPHFFEAWTNTREHDEQQAAARALLGRISVTRYYTNRTQRVLTIESKAVACCPDGDIVDLAYDYEEVRSLLRGRTARDAPNVERTADLTMHVPRDATRSLIPGAGLDLAGSSDSDSDDDDDGDTAGVPTQNVRFVIQARSEEEEIDDDLYSQEDSDADDDQQGDASGSDTGSEDEDDEDGSDIDGGRHGTGQAEDERTVQRTLMAFHGYGPGINSRDRRVLKGTRSDRMINMFGGNMNDRDLKLDRSALDWLHRKMLPSPADRDVMHVDMFYQFLCVLICGENGMVY